MLKSLSFRLTQKRLEKHDLHFNLIITTGVLTWLSTLHNIVLFFSVSILYTTVTEKGGGDD